MRLVSSWALGRLATWLVRSVTKREATRRAKVAVLDMLDQSAMTFIGDAAWAISAQDHDDMMTLALANNALRDSLARQWRLTRKR